MNLDRLEAVVIWVSEEDGWAAASTLCVLDACTEPSCEVQAASDQHHCTLPFKRIMDDIQFPSLIVVKAAALVFATRLVLHTRNKKTMRAPEGRPHQMLAQICVTRMAAVGLYILLTNSRSYGLRNSGRYSISSMLSTGWVAAFSPAGVAARHERALTMLTLVSASWCHGRLRVWPWKHMHGAAIRGPGSCALPWCSC